jgi:hypothetical protein
MPGMAVVGGSAVFSILHPKYQIKVELVDERLDRAVVAVGLVKYAFTPLAEGQMGAKRDNPGKFVPARTWNYWQTMPLRNGHHLPYITADVFGKPYRKGAVMPDYVAVVEDVGKYAGVKLVKWNGAFICTQEELIALPVVGILSGHTDFDGVYLVNTLAYDIQTTPLNPPLQAPVDLLDEDLPEIDIEVPVAAYTGDPFTVDDTGHFIGDDGFRVPRDFAEFVEWNPKYIENWVKRRLGRNAVDMDVEDWTQDLSIHMHYLPAKSKHRLPGANGREDGCKDVVETFNPIRQYGASERRFRHYVNNCLANRFSTIQSKRQKNPICRTGNLSLASCMEPENFEVVDDEYVHSHSERLSRATHSRMQQEEQQVFLSEYRTFLAQEDPAMLIVVNAIESTGTFGEAMRDLHMSEQEFSRARNRLKQLAVCFQEDVLVPKQRKPYKKRSVVV